MLVERMMVLYRLLGRVVVQRDHTLDCVGMGITSGLAVIRPKLV